jgi:hypothetical protein
MMVFHYGWRSPDRLDADSIARLDPESLDPRFVTSAGAEIRLLGAAPRRFADGIVA